MPLSCSVLTAPSDLEALRPAWEALLAESAADGPMLSPPWLLAWWRAFGAEGGRRLAVAAFHERDRLVGLAPLIARTVRHRPGIPFRRLELLGTGEPEADEVCSEHLGILAERGREGLRGARSGGGARPGRAGALGRDRPRPPRRGLAHSSRALASELARVGAPLDIEAAGSRLLRRAAALVRRAYTAKLSPGSRYLLSRSARDFERWAGGELAFHAARTPAEVEEGRRVLIALHGERWGGGGAFASPRFRAFHEEVMAAMFARGALEVLWMTARGEPFAAAYNLVWRGKLTPTTRAAAGSTYRGTCARASCSSATPSPGPSRRAPRRVRLPPRRPPLQARPRHGLPHRPAAAGSAPPGRDAGAGAGARRGRRSRRPGL